MAEPNTTAAAITAVPLVLVFTGLFGPMYGVYALIFAGAVTGSFFALIAAPPQSRWKAAGLVLRSVLLSLLMTGAASHVLNDYLGWSTDELYIFVSFAIAALGDKWLEIIDTLKTAIQNMLGDIFKKGQK